jgi:hypothetical protein
MTEEEKEEFRQIIRQELMAIIGTANQGRGFGAPSTESEIAVNRIFILLSGAITSHNSYAEERRDSKK